MEEKKRQSNQLGFQGLCSAFTLLIRYSSNSPLPKKKKHTHEEATLMKSEAQPCQPTTGASGVCFSNISSPRTSHGKARCRRCSSATFTSSPLGGDEVVVLAAM